MSEGFGNFWGKSQQQTKQGGDTLTPFGATPSSTSKDFAQQRAYKNQVPLKMDFPDHLFTPSGARDTDLRRVAEVAANTTAPVELFSFKAPQGAKTHFLAYSIFSDAINASDVEFIPRVNGNRVFTFHGDPNDNFKLNLGTGPDLSNANLIPVQLTLNPGEVFQWLVVNRNALVNIVMGARIRGYVDYTQTRNHETVGG